MGRKLLRRIEEDGIEGENRVENGWNGCGYIACTVGAMYNSSPREGLRGNPTILDATDGQTNAKKTKLRAMYSLATNFNTHHRPHCAPLSPSIPPFALLFTPTFPRHP